MARIMTGLGDIGSPRQTLNFISQRLQELRDAIEKYDRERHMWRVHEQNAQTLATILPYLSKKNQKLTRRMNKATREIAYLTTLRDSLNPCPYCHGSGNIVIAALLGKVEPCTPCNQTGLKSSDPA